MSTPAQRKSRNAFIRAGSPVRQRLSGSDRFSPNLVMMLVALILVLGLVLGGFWLTYFLLPPAARLPILMYHKVSENHDDKLTISAERLDGQLACLKRLGYQSVSFSDLKEYERHGVPLPLKP